MSETVNIRIAVVVSGDGSWNSTGWSGGGSDAELLNICLECTDPGMAEGRYFLEAEVPLPKVPTIPAKVEAGK